MVSANKIEILRIAETVAQEKMIEKEIVLSALEEAIAKAAKNNYGEENEVVAEASFTNDLGADSLDTVELIMEFEKEFDIQIPDDQAENIATVGQAISYIEEAK